MSEPNECLFGGGNDYMACLECGIEYDYRRVPRPPCPKLTAPTPGPRLRGEAEEIAAMEECAVGAEKAAALAYKSADLFIDSPDTRARRRAVGDHHARRATALRSAIARLRQQGEALERIVSGPRPSGIESAEDHLGWVMSVVRAARTDFPQPRRKDGELPCGECHIQPGEVCDICGASSAALAGDAP